MKICFHALYNFVNEIAFETLKNSGHYITSYLKKTWAYLCKAYLIEAKWYHSGYAPTLEEYLENAWISIGAPVIITHAYFVIPHSFKMEDLVHLEENPNIIRFSAMILRLANDLGTYKDNGWRTVKTRNRSGRSSNLFIPDIATARNFNKNNYVTVTTY
ncbi:hypothetical protein P8452_56892 [Trifolium repens]|nr:hypothetical protein P8452_56892 [Trifolium repens]